MTVDLSKIKPGDEVTVRMTVRSVEACDQFHLCQGDNTKAWGNFSGRNIVSHTPALAVGDRVKVFSDEDRWTDVGAVVAVRGEFAWVDWGDCTAWNARLRHSQLTRVDDQSASAASDAARQLREAR